MTIPGVSGIILAGGDSKRMGQDKNFLELGSKYIVEIVVEKMKGIFEEVVLVTNNSQSFEQFTPDVTIIEDRVKGMEKSSLRGIYSGLAGIQKEYGFVVAGDMPFIHSKLIKAMAHEALSGDWDVVVPKIDGYVEPLFSIYHLNCLPYIENQLHRRDFKVRRFFDHVKVCYVPDQFCRLYDQELLSFFNINTPDNLRIAQDIYQGHQLD